jgi:hypothetical protein
VALQARGCRERQPAQPKARDKYSSTAMKDCPVCGILAAPPSAPPGAAAFGGELCWRAEAVRLYRALIHFQARRPHDSLPLQELVARQRRHDQNNPARASAMGDALCVQQCWPPSATMGAGVPTRQSRRLRRSRRAGEVEMRRRSASPNSFPKWTTGPPLFFQNLPHEKATCCSQSSGHWLSPRGSTPSSRARCCDPGRRISRGAAVPCSRFPCFVLSLSCTVE